MKILTTDIVFVCGKRRSGKTYFVKWLIQKFPKTIVWDYNFEYSLKNSVIIYELNRLTPHFFPQYKHIIYRPVHKTEEDFNVFCEVVFRRFVNCVLVIEEVERYATPWYIPSGLKKIIDVGRHRGLGLVCTARRTMRTHGDIPFNADWIFAFHQHRPQDLDYLAEYMNPDVVYKLPRLPQYWFIAYEDRSGKTYVFKKI